MTLADLKALLLAFQNWYNEQRLHSRLEYRTPATRLADEVAPILC
ncbi:MAG: transposase [Candidatus Competibacteraceae bacterium]|nr:transposase [Candidatus Competibacteraceae bacterium]